MSNQPCDLCKNTLLILCDFFITPHFLLEESLTMQQMLCHRKNYRHKYRVAKLRFFAKLDVISVFGLFLLVKRAFLFEHTYKHKDRNYDH